ncbi:MAG: hypothetical protein DMF03_10265 [Verrucomicrobia bacterium]|nr:MAG: hypothetical protein DMF03_10265 [Verrucomicrobiota bacterium]
MPDSKFHQRIEKKHQFSLGKMGFASCCQAFFRDCRQQRLKHSGEREVRFFTQQEAENGLFPLLTTYG